MIIRIFLSIMAAVMTMLFVAPQDSEDSRTYLPVLVAPGGTPGILYDITFTPVPGDFTVTKNIWKVIERPDRTFELVEGPLTQDITDSCTARDVSFGSEEGSHFIVINKGGYIVCDNEGIPEELEAFIETETCAEESPCMRPSTVVVNAELRYEDSSEPFPLFHYRQSAPEATAERWLAMAFTPTGESHNFSWQIYGGVPGQPLEEKSDEASVSVPGEPHSNEFIFLQALRKAPDALDFTYEVRGQSQAQAGGELLMDEATNFEFFPGSEMFYIGDRNGVMTEGTKLYLKSLYFDPAESCAACN